MNLTHKHIIPGKLYKLNLRLGALNKIKELMPGDFIFITKLIYKNKNNIHPCDAPPVSIHFICKYGVSNTQNTYPGSSNDDAVCYMEQITS